MASGVNMPNLLGLSDNPVAVLDEMVQDRLVLILYDIGHGAWVNSAALMAAGYDAVPDALNGNIILRTAEGQTPGLTWVLISKLFWLTA